MLLLLLLHLSYAKPSPEDTHVDLYIPTDEGGTCYYPPIQKCSLTSGKHPDFRLLFLSSWNSHPIKSSVNCQIFFNCLHVEANCSLKGGQFAYFPTNFA